ncbi:MAG: MarR family winged helix-turn-helix transcriptional regulator [Marmoricola sp.]
MTPTVIMTPTVESAARTDAVLASDLRLSVMRLRRRLANERDPANQLSVGALSVLGVLFRSGECAVGQLAEHERVRPPSMTRIINCLVEDGYVARRGDEHDKRHVLVSITDRGKQTLQADRRRRDAWLARRLRELTPQERDALRKAAPIIERLATSS